MDENNKFISDLNSSNYTFLNSKKLIPFKIYNIKNGDSIRFADIYCSFKTAENEQIQENDGSLTQDFTETFYNANTQQISHCNIMNSVINEAPTQMGVDLHEMRTQVIINELPTQNILLDEGRNLFHDLPTQAFASNNISKDPENILTPNETLANIIDSDKNFENETTQAELPQNQNSTINENGDSNDSINFLEQKNSSIEKNRVENTDLDPTPQSQIVPVKINDKTPIFDSDSDSIDSPAFKPLTKSKYTLSDSGDETDIECNDKRGTGSDKENENMNKDSFLNESDVLPGTQEACSSHMLNIKESKTIEDSLVGDSFALVLSEVSVKNSEDQKEIEESQPFKGFDNETRVDINGAVVVSNDEVAVASEFNKEIIVIEGVEGKNETPVKPASEEAEKEVGPIKEEKAEAIVPNDDTDQSNIEKKDTSTTSLDKDSYAIEDDSDDDQTQDLFKTIHPVPIESVEVSSQKSEEQIDEKDHAQSDDPFDFDPIGNFNKNSKTYSRKQSNDKNAVEEFDFKFPQELPKKIQNEDDDFDFYPTQKLGENATQPKTNESNQDDFDNLLTQKLPETSQSEITTKETPTKEFLNPSKLSLSPKKKPKNNKEEPAFNAAEIDFNPSSSRFLSSTKNASSVEEELASMFLSQREPVMATQQLVNILEESRVLNESDLNDDAFDHSGMTSPLFLEVSMVTPVSKDDDRKGDSVVVEALAIRSETSDRTIGETCETKLKDQKDSKRTELQNSGIDKNQETISISKAPTDQKSANISKTWSHYQELALIRNKTKPTIKDTSQEKDSSVDESISKGKSYEKGGASNAETGNRNEIVKKKSNLSEIVSDSVKNKELKEEIRKETALINSYLDQELNRSKDPKPSTSKATIDKNQEKGSCVNITNTKEPNYVKNKESDSETDSRKRTVKRNDSQPLNSGIEDNPKANTSRTNRKEASCDDEGSEPETENRKVKGKTRKASQPLKSNVKDNISKASTRDKHSRALRNKKQVTKEIKDKSQEEDVESVTKATTRSNTRSCASKKTVVTNKESDSDTDDYESKDNKVKPKGGKANSSKMKMIASEISDTEDDNNKTNKVKLKGKTIKKNQTNKKPGENISNKRKVPPCTNDSDDDDFVSSPTKLKKPNTRSQESPKNDKPKTEAGPSKTRTRLVKKPVSDDESFDFEPSDQPEVSTRNQTSGRRLVCKNNSSAVYKDEVKVTVTKTPADKRTTRRRKNDETDAVSVCSDTSSVISEAPVKKRRMSANSRMLKVEEEKKLNVTPSTSRTIMSVGTPEVGWIVKQ